MRPLLVLSVLMLTACATPPPSAMRESGKPFASLTLDGEPTRIAECARTALINDPPNALNPPTPVIARDGDTVSVVGNASDGTVYVADLSPVDGGTRAMVYASSAYLYRRSNGEAVVSALRGCT